MPLKCRQTNDKASRVGDQLWPSEDATECASTICEKHLVLARHFNKKYCLLANDVLANDIRPPTPMGPQKSSKQ